MATAAQRRAKKKVSTRADQRLEDAAARTRFQPTRQALQGELNISTAMQGRIHDWFGNTANEIQQARNRSLQAYADAGTSLRTDADRSSQVDAQNRQQIDTAARADAARRGAVVGDSSQVGAQAEASRRSLSDAFLSKVTQQGLAAGDFLNTRGIANSQQELVAHQGEANRKASVRRQLTSLRGQEGDFRVTYRAQTAADRRKANLELAALGVKSGQLGINQQNANTNATRAANTNTNAQTGNKIAQQNADANTFKAHHPGKGAKKGNGPTRTQRVDASNSYSKGVSLMGVISPNAGKDERHAIAALVSKGVPADIARAAYQTHWFGGVKPALRRRLIKKYGLHTKKAKGSRVGSGVSGGTGAVGGALGTLLDSHGNVIVPK